MQAPEFPAAAHYLDAESAKGTVCLSFDIEADGDAPSNSNMLSIGIVAFDCTGSWKATFQRNLFPHSTKVPDQRCMEEFWAKNPVASAFVKTNCVTPEQGMRELGEFFTTLKAKTGNAKFWWVARPASYDWQWLNCYYHEFGPKEKPSLGFKARCISTMYDIYKEIHDLDGAAESAAWAEMTAGQAMTHNPLDDAKFQAVLYMSLCNRLGMKF
jgi:hypothetical protein